MNIIIIFFFIIFTAVDVVMVVRLPRSALSARAAVGGALGAHPLWSAPSRALRASLSPVAGLEALHTASLAASPSRLDRQLDPCPSLAGTSMRCTMAPAAALPRGRRPSLLCAWSSSWSMVDQRLACFAVESEPRAPTRSTHSVRPEAAVGGSRSSMACPLLGAPGA
jgi:hypothetical protein